MRLPALAVAVGCEDDPRSAAIPYQELCLDRESWSPSHTEIVSSTSGQREHRDPQASAYVWLLGWQKPPFFRRSVKGDRRTAPNRESVAPSSLRRSH